MNTKINKKKRAKREKSMKEHVDFWYDSLSHISINKKQTLSLFGPFFNEKIIKNWLLAVTMSSVDIERARLIELLREEFYGK